MNWENAIKHLQEVIRQYRSLIGMPGVNPYFGLMFLESLEKRYNSGERSDDLYTDMMECE